MNAPENINDRKISVYWLTLLLSNGINVYPVQNKKGYAVKRLAAVYPWMMCSAWLMVTLPAITSLLFNDYNFELSITTLAYITGSGCTLIQLVFSLLNRRNMYKMLTIMRDEFWYDGDRRSTADQLYARFVRTYGAVFPVANVMMCTAPLVWTFQNDGDIGSPNAYIYHMYMPWEPTVASYVAVYVAQFVIAFAANTNLANMVLSMIIFVNEMQVQMDILVDTVGELDVDDVYSGGKLDPDRTRRSYDDLVNCIKLHQTLIKYFSHFKSYFNIFYGFELVYILIMTCLTAGSVLLANGINVNMMALLALVVTQYLFCCLVGERFAWMNSQLGDCVYFKCLKFKSTKLARLGLLTILRSQKPLQLTAMGISKYTASLFTFTVTMKSVYAGINLLYNTLK